MLAIAIIVLALLTGYRSFNRTVEQDEEPTAVTSPPTTLSTAEAASEAQQGFIFGRVTTYDGVTYEGRLRFGGNEEAFWGDYFNGFKDKNPWLAQAPPEKLSERHPFTIFGVEFFDWESQVDLGRPFMARFGDIARIAVDGRDLRVTLKSGTIFHLDRYAADDVADGVRVWDATRGVVNLDEAEIHSIDFLPTGRLGNTPDRLHGIVRTNSGDFTGFIQWDRQKGVRSDKFNGHSADGELSLRFDTVRAIARKSSSSSVVTLVDGKEIVLSDTRDAGADNRGMYVDDTRYGRVLIGWDAFKRVDFSLGGSGPAYTDFPKGRPLTGSVTSHDGRRLAGRLVYDLDESENTETLDASSEGVDYTVFFDLIASIVLPAPEKRGDERARVILHNGQVLQLDLDGDLGEKNAGMLVFIDGRKQPEYVRWNEVREIHFDRP